MENITVRKVIASDTKTLQSIAEQTFRETFAAANTAANMEKYLLDNFNEEKVLSEINNPDSFFYFTQLNDVIIGYLKLNIGSAQTELKENKGMEIERIYVLSHYQGLKVGQLLYEKALDIAASKRAEFIWLGVWDQNYRAIRFYEKNGFIPFDKHLFTLGNDQQTDIMMRLNIAP